MSVSTLLRKEKDGTMFKGSSFGDTEPLWQDNNVGKVDFESKVPVKLNPRVVAPDTRQGDVPTANTTGAPRAEDGRSNATTMIAGPTANGDIVPDALPQNYKISCMLDELCKLGAISDEEAMDTLQRLDAMDKNKLTPGQVGRYAAIGAVAGPAVNMARSVIQKKNYFKDAPSVAGKARYLLGDAAAGAATSGGIPILRSALDRRAAKSNLQEYMQGAPPHVQMPPPVGDDAAPMVEPPPKIASGLSGAHAEHITDLAGLGAMAVGSGSHLIGQLRQRNNPQASESGPISTSGQAGLDLAGLTAMALPTIAALNALRKGHAPGAGGGSKFVNRANLAGLGALAVPTADKMQAHLRAGDGEDPESKMLLGHGAHKALELGGYGTLMAGALKNPDNSTRDKLLQGAGYAALAAPQVVPVEGVGRTALELGGLGALALPSAMSLRGHNG
jgi:hypothetical protein